METGKPAMRLFLAEGDITRFHGDAIVNAANPSLLGGGGVDGAIHHAAGPEMLRECRAIGGCPTGQARITHGYRLAVPYVIHTVGPVWHGGTHGEAGLLNAAYTSSLALAERERLGSIAFCAISTGVYGYPLAEATHLALTTILRWLAGHVLPERVTCVCFDDRFLEAYRREVLLLTGMPPLPGEQL